MTREIPLTKGYVALVDDADYELISAFGKWCAKVSPQAVYAMRCAPKRDGGGWTSARMHTVLTGWSRTDHINGNGLDNRRSNLRPVTNRQNAQNMRGRSKFKGVSWEPRTGKWRVEIRTEERRLSLGHFADEASAALAYDTAARLHHGQFAALNFPRSGENSALRERVA